jgi:hypothetical protein
MAKLTMAERRKLPKSDFAVPSKAPGAGSYPMPDAKHAAVAKGFAKMHGGPTGAVAKKAKQKGFAKGGPVRGQGGMGVKFNPAIYE